MRGRGRGRTTATGCDGDRGARVWGRARRVHLLGVAQVTAALMALVGFGAGFVFRDVLTGLVDLLVIYFDER